MLRNSACPADQPPLLYDHQLHRLVHDTCHRIQREMTRYAPFLADEVCDWMAYLSPTRKAPDYFLQPDSFPLLPLIWWAARNFADESDEEFVADVVYATANMYYYIRLIDNVMDGHGSGDLKILPASAFFHTEFQGTYQRHFAVDHPFWEVFRSAWFAGSEAVTHEFRLPFIRPEEFERVTVAKLSAARIPVAAVALFCGAAERLPRWNDFVMALGRWSQLQDDLFDWHHDLRHHRTSWFLTEALRMKGDASVEEWIVTGGFEQGMERLRRELLSLREVAAPLHSTDVAAYLDRRQAMLEDERVSIAAAFKVLLDVATIVESRVQGPG